MLEKYHLSDLDLETLDNDAVRQIETDMKKNFLTSDTTGKTQQS